MLKILLYLMVGAVSDFIIVKYYKHLSLGNTFAVLVCNSGIFIVNVLFVGLIKQSDWLSLSVYFLGQSLGIIAAMEINFNRGE